MENGSLIAEFGLGQDNIQKMLMLLSHRLDLKLALAIANMAFQLQLFIRACDTVTCQVTVSPVQRLILKLYFIVSKENKMLKIKQNQRTWGAKW